MACHRLEFYLHILLLYGNNMVTGCSWLNGVPRRILDIRSGYLEPIFGEPILSMPIFRKSTPGEEPFQRDFWVKRQ